MKETDDQCKLRRAISANLTQAINDAARFPAIRAAVIDALASCDRRLIELTEKFRKDYFLRVDAPLVRFYIKGGNAFDAWMSYLDDPHQNHYGSGDSDWDTQVVVDPWLPLPLQDLLYAEIEELVLDVLRSAGITVATVAGAIGPPDAPLAPRVYEDKDSADGIYIGTDATYFLKRDETQTLRKIFDHDLSGLWTDERRKLSDDQAPYPDLIPGIVLNDAIKPFRLYRLGYTWHARWVDVDGGAPGRALEVDRPILMELIDVTLPREDTIEAVGVWAEIERGQLPIRYVKGDAERWALPLPDVYYHLRENITMLCEIADGSSRHANKEPKRRARFEKILDHCKGLADGGALFMQTLARMAGEDLGAAAYPADTIVDLLKASVQRRTLAAAANFVGRVVSDQTRQRIADARNLLRGLVDALRLSSPVDQQFSAAFSDDLVLVDFVAWNPVIAVEKVTFSGIDKAAVVRVSHQQFLAIQAQAFENVLQQRRDPQAPPLTVRTVVHNTSRPGGVTYEQTLVILEGERAVAMLTLTTATAAESPFRPDAEDPNVDYCSLVELAGQRKAAASLIEDYVVRTAFSRQYKVLKELLPGV